mgnify:CR=1 FL=1
MTIEFTCLLPRKTMVWTVEVSSVTHAELGRGWGTKLSAGRCEFDGGDMGGNVYSGVGKIGTWRVMELKNE